MILIATAWPVRRSTLGGSVSENYLLAQSQRPPFVDLPKAPTTWTKSETVSCMCGLQQTDAILSRVQCLWVHRPLPYMTAYVGHILRCSLPL